MKKEKISEKEYKKIYPSLCKKEYAIINFEESTKRITLQISGAIKGEMASKNRLTKEDLEAIGFLLKPIYEKLDEHSKKFELVFEKLDEHTKRLDNIDQKINIMDQKINLILATPTVAKEIDKQKLNKLK
ncbi:MAG: hypothetical protein ACRCRZ_02215 [Metamycoplasmataceae bacterium]